MHKQQQESRADADRNEEEGSSVDGDDDDRLAFVRLIPVDAPELERRVLEVELRTQDAIATRNECDRATANWTHHKDLWSEL